MNMSFVFDTFYVANWFIFLLPRSRKTQTPEKANFAMLSAEILLSEQMTLICGVYESLKRSRES